MTTLAAPNTIHPTTLAAGGSAQRSAGWDVRVPPTQVNVKVGTREFTSTYQPKSVPTRLLRCFRTWALKVITPKRAMDSARKAKVQPEPEMCGHQVARVDLNITKQVQLLINAIRC